MPRIERRTPPYVQITDHYRGRILDGTLREGDPLPGIHAIAEEWGTSSATAAKALSQLGVEGLIRTTPGRGSFVAALSAKANTPQDRVLRARRTGTTAAAAESHRVTAAERVVAPTYVAELFDMEPGEEVIRREWTTGEGKERHCLTVTWHRGALADDVPELLQAEQSLVGAMLPQIEDAVGQLTKGRDFYHARGADSREASMLGLPVGAAVLAMTWLLWTTGDDGDQLVEYGESVLPARHTVSYPYDLDGPST